MTPAQSLLAALFAAVSGPAAPAGVVRPVLTPLPPRPVREPERTPLPGGEDLGARVVSPIGLRDAPRGAVVARIGPRTTFGSPRVLPVVRRQGSWLGVIATERPNGRLGWIPAAGAQLVGVPVRLTVNLSTRRLTVVDRGRAVARMAVGVGSATSPTPTGWFAVTDGLRGWGPYGCCILALSGHQRRLPQGWTGGDRLAVHGTPSAGIIAGATTLGCLRADAADLRRLLRLANLGSRVHIEA
jgi:hypothetical protein